MNSIFTFFSSLANLARACNRLASVADAVADEAERRVEVIGHTSAAPVPSLLLSEGPPLASTNGNSNGHAELAKAGGRSRK